jgi:hypothetical protein
MPMIRKRYPANWEAIARLTKQQSGWHCEACGKPCLLPQEDFLDFLIRCQLTVGEAIDLLRDAEGKVNPNKEHRFRLTAAHPNHDPENPAAELRAWCNPCHCRYDLKAMALKRRLKREYNGQLFIDGLGLVEPTLAGQGKQSDRIQLPIPITPLWVGEIAKRTD